MLKLRHRGNRKNKRKLKKLEVMQLQEELTEETTEMKPRTKKKRKSKRDNLKSTSELSTRTQSCFQATMLIHSSTPSLTMLRSKVSSSR